MAIMYPGDLSQYTPTDSERIVYYDLKQQLPDSFSVFYSVKWSAYKNGHLIKSEADFIVESPDHGFLSLEVKGGSGIRIDGPDWYLEDNQYGDRKLNESPYDQAEKSMYYFRDSFSNRYNTGYNGVYGSGVVFPFYSVGERINLSDRQKDCTIDFGDMNSLHERIIKMFRMWGGASYGHRYYSNSQHSAFLELIRERVAIEAAAGALVQYKERQLSIINRVQDNYVYFLSNTDQFYIRGGAGTGKTWIAMKMAKADSQCGDRKVLFLCQSPFLAKQVMESIGDTVTVLDTTSLFSSIIESFDSFAPPAYCGISRAVKKDAEKYDSIFVDEAQDFTDEWAELVRDLLRNPDLSRLGVFYDDVQVLREDSFGDGFGINSKPFLLRENIRNTSSIYKWTAEKTRLGMDVVVNPVEGPTPRTEIVHDPNQMTHYLEDLFRRYLEDEKLPNSSLVIISDDADGFVDCFSGGIAEWQFTRNRAEQENEIPVFSVGEMKGLEADMVLYIHDSNTSDNENYIAYTRAKYYLIELLRDY